MLHFARSVALGVYVRDLFELESALERHWEAQPSPEEENVARSGVVTIDVGDRLVRRLEAFVDQVWDTCQPFDELAGLRPRSASPRRRPSQMLNIKRLASWAMKHFVEATPISGPACV